VLCPKCHFENPEDSNFCFQCATPLTSLEGRFIIDAQMRRELEKKLTKGSVVEKKFEILEELGEGGMGVVYKARDIKLNRSVALKFLPLELTRDQAYKVRFAQEAQAASALDHQNICTIYDIDETSDGQMYIAMAYYEGETLKEKIAHGSIPVHETVDISKQVAQGLVKAHDRSIIHRDIKPANIMFTKDGVVKILDFGLSKQVDKEITRTAAVMGTIAYMPPEQASGENLDHRTDLWSLGVVIYEMLTGRLPFEGEHGPAIIHAIMYKSPIPPTELRSDISRNLERIVLKCLQKDPMDRYRTAKLFLSDLINLEEDLGRDRHGVIVGQRAEPEVRKEAERRQATVMFVDIVGTREINERMDTEETTLIMTRCFRILGSIVEKYGGTIRKITDMSFRVLFGVPTAIEDAPKKAVNTIIEIRNNLYQFSQEEKLQIPLEVNAGIDTGMVIVGAMETDDINDFAAMGDAVNLASLLKDHAGKGKVYVGRSTFRYTREEFEYAPLKPITLKDWKEPVAAFELLSEKESIYRDITDSDRMIHSVMVGRAGELNKLQFQVLKVINGEGSIVNIIGEAGIGKSRLIAELVSRDEMINVHLLKGRALSIGKNLSFHPIIDIIRNWSHMQENDSILESFQKLEQAVLNVYPENGAEVFPFIATLMGMKLAGNYAERVRGIEGEALEKLILKSLRELMGKISEQKPLVIIVEDLHWADLTSVGILESLYRLAEEKRILFINVFRPDYKDTSSRILDTIKSRYPNIHSELYLKSLDENQSGILINNLLKIKSLPASIQGLITKRAEGNPFFIEEVVRSLIDDGVVETKEGRFKITEKIDSVVIPKTINEVLMARIDKLDENTRSLLKVASVIGRNFFYKILMEVAKSIEEIDDRLDYLLDVQLILKRRRMEELEYLFKHALAQEATYESILLKQRRQLHLQIAKAIESVFSERIHEFYGMLTLHYGKGEDLDKAEEYLIKAGEEALKSSASSEALHYYQEALNLYLKKYGDAADMEKIAMLTKNIALAFFNKGQYVEAVGYFNETLAYHGEKLPKHPVSAFRKFLFGFVNFLVSLYFPKLKKVRSPDSKDKEIINLYERKIRALSTTDPKRMFIESFYWMKRLTHSKLAEVDNGVGILSMSSGLFCFSGISFRFSRKILEYVKDQVDKKDVKSLLFHEFSKMMHSYFTGDWDMIEEFDDNLVDCNLRIGEIWIASNYLLYHGYTQNEQGSFAASQKMIHKLSEISHTFEHDYSRSMKYLLNTKSLMKYRKLHEALAEIMEGHVYFDRLGYTAFSFSLYSYKARVLMFMGDIKEAEKCLLEAERIKSEMNIAPIMLIQYFLSRFSLDIYLLENSIKNENQAESSKIKKTAFKNGKKTAKISRKVAAELTEACKLMGTYYWLVDKQKRALKWWEKSIEMGENTRAKLELSRTFLEIGKRLAEEKSQYKELNGINSQQYLEKARNLYKEMDLKWDLEGFENGG
jgi:class 3 adenylate cyclase/tRNA A-37 threonylcarbamoyl transferase component Bud32/tetratricopeptide (TPR) repeat protein